MRVRDDEEDWGIRGSEAATKIKVKGGVTSRSVTRPFATLVGLHLPIAGQPENMAVDL